jgi:phytoene synthase
VTGLGIALEAAGIRDRDLEHCYRTTARATLRADPAHHAAVRNLVPARWQPHVLAAYWFARATDSAADSGPVEGRRAHLERWARTVTAALTDAAPTDPRLRAFAHTVSACGLPKTWIEGLIEGMRTDAEGAGPLDEAGLRGYVDKVSLPYLKVLVGVHPGMRDPGLEPGLRHLAEACQRADFLADLAADRRARRANPADEARAAHRPAGDYLAAELERARRALADARPLLERVPEALRPMARAQIALCALRLRTVERKGIKVFDRQARYPILGSARILLAGRQEARHA